MNMSLKIYRSKRNVHSTPEPFQSIHTPAKALRFVVQKHRASHLHYDFRLELNGVLKSWAVPKGPSLNPSDKRLAMMVEDHPLEYQHFEGIIPPGNYGAGEVIIWDTGVYAPIDGTTKKEQEQAIKKGITKGHLSFVLFGDRLKGAFSLVKLPSANHNSWLLIKHPDTYASTHSLTSIDTSIVSGNSLAEMRDYHQLNNTDKLNQPTIHPMLATLTDKPFDHPDWLFEIKWDGYRAIAVVSGDQVALYSRSGKPLTNAYPEITADLSHLSLRAIFDGEIVVVDSDGRPEFQLLQNYQDTHEGTILYYIFDILSLNDTSLTHLPLIERKRILTNTIQQGGRIRLSEYRMQHGIDLFNAVSREGVEGIIAKKTDSTYQPGTRSRSWLKIKHLQQQEVVIGGYTEPRGSRKHLGALLVGVYDRDKLRYVGHTGGGLNTQELKDLTRRLAKLEQSDCPFSTRPKPNAPVHWVKPELICEVSFSEWTDTHTMRQPIYKGLREDIAPNEVHFEKSFAHENFFPTIADERKRVTIDHHTLTLSNQSKLFWPNRGYTKGDLIAYYRAIGHYILPFLRNRPQSLHRHPHGIQGNSFFQKNIPDDFPAWIPRTPVQSGSEERTIYYCICNDLATLVYLTNLGCIELNVWNSATQHLRYPDYLVVDLDPGTNSFDEVVAVARATKYVFDTIGLPSFCKTSGLTGLHVFVPLVPNYTHDQVRDFAELVLRFVHEDTYKLTSLERDPKKRHNKIYLDYLQNRFGQTMASAYSVRPSPNATVSTPLTWNEVKPGLDPNSFTLQTMPKRLASLGDAWQSFFKSRSTLNNAFKKLQRL